MSRNLKILENICTSIDLPKTHHYGDLIKLVLTNSRRTMNTLLSCLKTLVSRKNLRLTMSDAHCGEYLHPLDSRTERELFDLLLACFVDLEPRSLFLNKCFLAECLRSSPLDCTRATHFYASFKHLFPKEIDFPARSHSLRSARRQRISRYSWYVFVAHLTWNAIVTGNIDFYHLVAPFVEIECIFHDLYRLAYNHVKTHPPFGSPQLMEYICHKNDIKLVPALLLWPFWRDVGNVANVLHTLTQEEGGYKPNIFFDEFGHFVHAALQATDDHFPRFLFARRLLNLNVDFAFDMQPILRQAYGTEHFIEVKIQREVLSPEATNVKQLARLSKLGMSPCLVLQILKHIVDVDTASHENLNFVNTHLPEPLPNAHRGNLTGCFDMNNLNDKIQKCNFSLHYRDLW